MKRLIAALAVPILALPLSAQEPQRPDPGPIGIPLDEGWELLGDPAAADAVVVDRTTAEPQAPRRDPDRTVFYRPPPPEPEAPEGPTVLLEPTIDDFPVKPGEFNSAPYVMSPDALPVVARFIRSLRNDFDAWGGTVSAHPQDRVFLEYAGQVRPEVGEALVILAIGDRLPGVEPAQHIIHPMGVVRVEILSEEAIEGQIEAQYGVVYPGQLLVPLTALPEFSAPAAEAVPDGYDLEGRIVSFVEDKPLYGRADLAFVDLGTQDGVQVGDVFRAYLPEREEGADMDGEDGPGGLLPPSAVGDLRVVRVTEHAATVKVDRLTLARLRAELPVRRVRRMP